MIEERVNFYNNPKTELENNVDFYRTTGEDPKFKDLVKELDEDLVRMYSNMGYKFDIDIKVDTLNTVVLASIGDIVIGGGCFKPISEDTAEVKRVFVSPYFRGISIGSGLMEEIICWAKELNIKQLVLETGELQTQSIRLFKKCGFNDIQPFGPYIGMEGSVCMGKTL